MEKQDFTILYVDDEEQNLISFKAAFRRKYQVLTAHSGEEGLRIMRDFDVDLIITDQRMPGMTGVQFLERILPEFPDTIRMVLTGFSDIEDIIDAINNGGVFRYITKPWDELELQMTIENARQISALQRKNKKLLLDLKQKVEEQERTLKLFVRYVPEQVVEKALSTSGDTVLDGETRYIAVLFCDIRGFTPLSETLAPRETVAFLNDYYSLMGKAIKRHGGAVYQFVGDEISATFGAPIDHAHKERSAVFCALEMREKLEQLNRRYCDRFGCEIEIGISVHAGEVVAGNLGSEDRIGYSVTGDTVNTAKRIETLTKGKSNLILISDQVYAQTQHLLDVNVWEPQAVKGKKDKIQVYEVLRRK
ncbi:Adenylate cyclase, class 3 [Catalinimonas alkaloidigena]|uniref:Adenylate cyclase, class 3 n=1 Tax=Catalinimonas alkaloidigena TaxID=1075417 RepID=A0A1G8WLW7_9BACT|nr:adenylate/guanylate cyclase domain-containing protein [Catalinimonas alkaloidigena]SDJ79349.1 Adenylate cyclase, class 3 [Catalinimonas alkaloidigena]